MTELHVPGVSIAVVHNDQSSGHEGSVKPGRKAPVAENILFQAEPIS
jgi:hypothetical protein